MKNASPVFSPKASFGREERSSTQNTIPAAAVAEVRQFEVIKIAIDMHSAMWVASRQLVNRGKSLLLEYGLGRTGSHRLGGHEETPAVLIHTHPIALSTALLHPARRLPRVSALIFGVHVLSSRQHVRR